ncbi:molybdopterin-guanine dinucleotide biosynthesis protein MobB [Sphingomicrobium flavum]|uniref:molybdopterin-guanine dinucleotide biosynthesis protein MobB n=1 Tax=Sphingomicrobium flavum TaxID=1229164 RepID=UPI0021AE0BCC|nr:molybdopterin-guanine dinucleotide biosynthesis protein MobB [Sphingomicrobium flavum]
MSDYSESRWRDTVGGVSIEAADKPKWKPTRERTCVRLSGCDLAKAKRAFTTRRVPIEAMQTLVNGPLRPRTGDLVLARVDRVRYQRRIELTDGRKANITEGDLIIVAYGDRYATDQFEAEVPNDLGPTNLVATGGVAGKMLSKNSAIRAATDITPLGLVADGDGKPLNLHHFRVELDRPFEDAERPRVVCVLGTSMNSGKTTTNLSMVQGLVKAGYRVGVAKVTGTGSGGDYWQMVDAGATFTVDFTDAGYSATYKLATADLEAIAIELVTYLSHQKLDIILIEVADGLYQEQNLKLLDTETFQSIVDAVFFAAGDAMGAGLGIGRAEMFGYQVIGLSGKLTASELLIREAEALAPVPVYRKQQLSDPHSIGAILSLPPIDQAERHVCGATDTHCFGECANHAARARLEAELLGLKVG